MEVLKIIRRTAFFVLAIVYGGLPGVGFADPVGPGTFVGVFSNPILFGNTIIAGGGGLTFYDNTSSAVYSGVGTDTLVWGTNTQTSPPPFSFLRFTGTPFSLQPPDTPFTVGQIEFSNGTSALESLIFGATLTLTLPGAPSVTPLVIPLVINTTINSGISQILDADNLQFLGQFPEALLAFEGFDVTADMIGQFVGDPTLDLIGLQLPPGQAANGAIGIAPSAIPEPSSTALFALALLGLAVSRRRGSK